MYMQLGSGQADDKAPHFTPATTKIVADLAERAMELRFTLTSKHDVTNAYGIIRDLIQAMYNADHNGKPDTIPAHVKKPADNSDEKAWAEWLEFAHARAAMRHYERAQKALKSLLLEANAVLEVTELADVKNILNYSVHRRYAIGSAPAVPKCFRPANPNTKLPVTQAELWLEKKLVWKGNPA